MEQMQQIRDQQESLARLHFELGARQETQRDPFSDDGLLRANNEVRTALSWPTRRCMRGLVWFCAFNVMKLDAPKISC